jgi:hypothetical protein
MSGSDTGPGDTRSAVRAIPASGERADSARRFIPATKTAYFNTLPVHRPFKRHDLRQATSGWPTASCGTSPSTGSPSSTSSSSPGREDVYFGFQFAKAANKLSDDSLRYYLEALGADPDALRGSFAAYRAHSRLWPLLPRRGSPGGRGRAQLVAGAVPESS